MIIVFVLFVVTDVFANLADILTQRVMIALVGAILIARGFGYPIPKAEIIVPAPEKEVEGIEQLEVT